MKRLLVLLAFVSLFGAAAAAQAGCRPRPHGPWGGPCYACGGHGYARGYPTGYYGFGSWGYSPGYALGNHGYGSGFGGHPAYSTEPGYSFGYYGPGYQSGYASGRNYGVVCNYFGSGGYLNRRPAPRDLGGEFGGIMPQVTSEEWQPEAAARDGR